MEPSSLDLRHFLETRFQKPYTKEKIVSLFAVGVIYLAKVNDLPNEEKKPLLLNTIRDLIEMTDLDQYQKDLLKDIVDSIGDMLIEQLIILGKDAVTFIKKKSVLCLSKCRKH